jgi:hypothetical protein
VAALLSVQAQPAVAQAQADTPSLTGAAIDYGTSHLERRLEALRHRRPHPSHRPLSDFFLVYNERRDERTAQMLTRALIAKMTCLVAF